MQEFIYYSKEQLDFPLDESIYVTNRLEDVEGDEYLISNSKDIDAEMVANEIDFYIKNSTDNMATKISNVKKLYEISAQKLDNAKDFPYQKDIGNKILLIANLEDARSIMREVQANEFDMFHIDESILKSIDGQIGELKVIVDDNGKDVELSIDQIIWFEAKEEGLKQSGTFDPKKSSVDDVLKTIRANIEHFEYRKFTTYDKNICQYHERREEICGRCEEVCPTVAIVKDESKKHLEFSQIDCHGCGGCISVCPSGALDYAPISKDSIYEMSLNFKDTHPLIIPNKMSLENLSVQLKENVLPFKIEGEKFLHEATLLTIAQVSGSQLVFYTDFLSKGTIDAIKILNTIYQKKYGQDAIIVAANQDELIDALQEVKFIEGSKFNINQEDLRKREIFSTRVAHIVGNEDLGTVETGPNVHYGVVNVNAEKCTLCLSCVGACNVDALIADAKTYELRVNPSLCTSCGYCEVTCAEDDCLTITRDTIELNPTFFAERTLAKDKLFACTECGKEFATSKAIERVANIMKPIFGNDDTKIKTLYACEDCKPKIMMKKYYEDKMGVN